MDTDGVQVAPFGLKLCQNVAPRLRIIFQALLGPKTLFKNQKHPKISKIRPDVRNIVRHVRHVRHVRNMFPRPGTTFGANIGGAPPSIPVSGDPQFRNHGNPPELFRKLVSSFLLRARLNRYPRTGAGGFSKCSARVFRHRA